MATRSRIRAASDDDGIGLVEIMVAVLLLGILLGAIAPLLINGIRTSAKMATIATATRDASQALEQARSRATSCATADGLATDPAFADIVVADARGVQLRRRVEISSTGAGSTFQQKCAASHLVQARVTLTAVDDTVLFRAGHEVASASTSVYVP